jgi:hypothetical protein
MATHPRFGNINQNRLREIVRMKNEENNLSKKDIIKKIDATNVTTLRQQPLLPVSLQPRKNPLEVLPRIKIHSEPNYQ